MSKKGTLSPALVTARNRLEKLLKDDNTAIDTMFEATDRLVKIETLENKLGGAAGSAFDEDDT